MVSLPAQLLISLPILKFQGIDKGRPFGFFYEIMNDPMCRVIVAAAKELICDSCGTSVWSAICSRACVTEIRPYTFTGYHEEATFALVEAIAESFHKPAPEVLEGLGEYWTRSFANWPETNVDPRWGASFEAFMANFDAIFSLMLACTTDTWFRPAPSFAVTKGMEGGLQLHHYSLHSGFAPMVVGLVKGLDDHFGIRISVTHVEKVRDGASHDIFRVVHAPR